MIADPAPLLEVLLCWRAAGPGGADGSPVAAAATDWRAPPARQLATLGPRLQHWQLPAEALATLRADPALLACWQAGDAPPAAWPAGLAPDEQLFAAAWLQRCSTRAARPDQGLDWDAPGKQAP